MARFGRTAQSNGGQARALIVGLWSLGLLTLVCSATLQAQFNSDAVGVDVPQITAPPEVAPAAIVEPAPRPLSSSLSVDPGATCLGRERLAERVVRWLERDEVDPELRVQVRGDAQLATRVFFSVVRGPGESSERRLDNAPVDCDQLHSAVALSIALAIDATLRPASGDLTPIPTARAALREAQAGNQGSHLELAVLGGASMGVLTGAALAGVPRLELAILPWFKLAAVGLATYLTGETIDQVTGSFESMVLAGGLEACFGGQTTQQASFFMCAGGRGGTFQSRGAGFNRGSDTINSTWWALTASGQARFWISPVVGIGIGVEALYALVPIDIAAVGVGREAPKRLRPVPRVGLTVTLGPVFHLF